MDPTDQFAFEGLDPANCFAMDGLNMAFAAEFVADGKPLLKGLFLDIMTEKNPNVGGSYKTFTTWFSIGSKHW